MLEADVFCLAGLVYSAFVCLTSMSLFWWLELRIPHEWDWLLDVGVIVWIGAAMSFLAWMKVWMVRRAGIRYARSADYFFLGKPIV